MAATRDKCFDVIRRDARPVVTRWPPSPLGSSFGPLAAGRFTASASESPVGAEPSCASSTSADSVCQALLGRCAAPAGAAAAGVNGGAAGTALACFPPPTGAAGLGAPVAASAAGFGAAGADAAAGAGVDAFGPAVSDVEAEASPAFGAGAPVSLWAGLGSLTGLGWDSPADL